MKSRIALMSIPDNQMTIRLRDEGPIRNKFVAYKSEIKSINGQDILTKNSISFLKLALAWGEQTGLRLAKSEDSENPSEDTTVLVNEQTALQNILSWAPQLSELDEQKEFSEFFKEKMQTLGVEIIEKSSGCKQQPPDPRQAICLSIRKLAEDIITFISLPPQPAPFPNEAISIQKLPETSGKKAAEQPGSAIQDAPETQPDDSETHSAEAAHPAEKIPEQTPAAQDVSSEAEISPSEPFEQLADKNPEQSEKTPAEGQNKANTTSVTEQSEEPAEDVQNKGAADEQENAADVQPAESEEMATEEAEQTSPETKAPDEPEINETAIESDEEIEAIDEDENRANGPDKDDEYDPDENDMPESVTEPEKPKSEPVQPVENPQRDNILINALASFKPNVLLEILSKLIYSARSQSSGEQKSTNARLGFLRSTNNMASVPENQYSIAMAQFIKLCDPVGQKPALLFAYESLTHYDMADSTALS